MTPSHAPPGVVWNVSACPSRPRILSASSSASARSAHRLSGLSRSSPAHVAEPHQPRFRACRTSTRRSSWIDLLQEGFEVGEAVTPEHAVMAHPIDERREALRLGAIIDIAALGALGDQAGLLQ